MAVTLGEAADISGQPRGGLWTTAVGAAPYPSLMLTSPGLDRSSLVASGEVGR